MSVHTHRYVCVWVCDNERLDRRSLAENAVRVLRRDLIRCTSPPISSSSERLAHNTTPLLIVSEIIKISSFHCETVKMVFHNNPSTCRETRTMLFNIRALSVRGFVLSNRSFSRGLICKLRPVHAARPPCSAAQTSSSSSSGKRGTARGLLPSCTCLEHI